MVNQVKAIRDIRTAVKVTLDSSLAHAQKIVVTEIYKDVVARWPNDTFWSISNHRISITGSPILRLEPKTRPTKKGALISKHQSVMLSELSKLDKITTKTRKIIIGNSVPYAADVGGKKGFGRMIYAEAARNGAARAKGILKKDVPIIGRF